jgi:hypothetical protein
MEDGGRKSVAVFTLPPGGHYNPVAGQIVRRTDERTVVAIAAKERGLGC